ncbi:hypothetical protein [Streptomyces tsukubensis]|uniref:Uncharacterized protein n=1 Tax=Streptomyces tsukubensis TaxID=83656 RepID=A0A1V4A0D2_9ACTN|nr:hypothetical protein [Streptomyces tsukubensis]OON71945.1 hypothetical protein B1H18_31825 [Streptomyces tsukubensis]QFR96894.1 hypothetical protein GBW32_32420 [Streptomyces tsukubensis]
MACTSQVNIIAVVDVIGALSGSTLFNGSLCLIDNSRAESTGQHPARRLARADARVSVRADGQDRQRTTHNDEVEP